MPRLVVIYKCLRWHVIGPTLTIPHEWGWESYGGKHYGHSYFNFTVDYIGPPAHYENMKQLLCNFYTSYSNQGYIGHFIIRDDMINVENENINSPHLQENE